MQPVEINAGAWYLLPRNTADWLSDACYRWAVCAATTGDSLAEVTLDPLTGNVGTCARDGGEAAAAAAAESVRRFAAAIAG